MVHPILWTLQLGDRTLDVAAYDSAIVAAVLVFIVGGAMTAARDGLPGRRVFFCLLAITVAAVAGARVLHGAIHAGLYAKHPELLAAARPGRLALQGGVIAALAAGLCVARVLRIDRWRLADAVAPAIGLAIVVLRLGCFLNGCCFGQATELPWGVVFPSGSLVHLHQASGGPSLLFEAARPVHPTQLYEAAAALAAFAIAVGIRRMGGAGGAAFLAAGASLAAMQWGIFHFRAEIGEPGPLRFVYPWLSAGLALVGSLLLLWRWRKVGIRRRENGIKHLFSA